LVPSPVSHGWKDAIAYARRQYTLIRMHTPAHWILIAVITTLPLAGWAVALPLAAKGSVGAIVVIVVANACDQLRAYFLRRVPLQLWNVPIAPRVARLDQWGTPIWLLVNAVVVWSTLFGRRIRWAGRTYWIDSKLRVARITDSANG